MRMRTWSRQWTQWSTREVIGKNRSLLRPHHVTSINYFFQTTVSLVHMLLRSSACIMYRKLSTNVKMIDNCKNLILAHKKNQHNNYPKIAVLLTNSIATIEPWIRDNIYARKVDSIGVDIEWKPSHTKGSLNKAALLQVSINPTTCFVNLPLHTIICTYVPTYLPIYLIIYNYLYVFIELSVTVHLPYYL